MDRCTYCNSTLMESIPGPHIGGNFANVVCSQCGRFARWPRKPDQVNDSVSAATLAMVHPRRRPTLLRGSEFQCRFARSLRARALFSFTKLGRTDLVDLVRCIVDATWFIANQGRPLGRIRWPSPLQMESVDPTGTCPRCGDPIYGASACSD